MCVGYERTAILVLSWNLRIFQAHVICFCFRYSQPVSFWVRSKKECTHVVVRISEFGSTRWSTGTDECSRTVDTALYISLLALCALDGNVSSECVWECKHLRAIVTNIPVFTCREKDRCRRVNDTCIQTDQSDSAWASSFDIQPLTRASDLLALTGYCQANNVRNRARSTEYSIWHEKLITHAVISFLINSERRLY